jgi:glycerophosphoryl diester phosphodiesterase
MILLDPNARPVIGHRGAAAHAPENTIESFALALEQGADALEFDVRRAADGVPVVFHDPVLDRTTDRTGPVGALTSAELARVDAGYRFVDEATGAASFRGRGVRVATLREVIAAFPSTPFLIEMKEAGVQEAVARDLADSGAVERAVLAGSDWRALLAFRAAPFHLGASQRDIARLYFGFGAPDSACRCYAVPDAFRGLPIPTRRFVRKAHARAATVHVWTVDDAALARTLWARGVNGVVTNRPGEMRAARDNC